MGTRLQRLEFARGRGKVDPSVIAQVVGTREGEGRIVQNCVGHDPRPGEG